MNIDNLTNIIELPLKLLDWVVNNLVLILVLGGCGYLIYWVFRNRIKIAEKINKLRGIIPKKEIKEVPYYDRLIHGDKVV